MKYAGKTNFWRKGKLELPLPCANSYEQSQLQPKSLYSSQSWKNSITYAKYMWKMCVYALHMQSTCGKCVYVLLCATYVPSISQMHTVVLLQGKCKSINVYRRAIYIYIYTHTMFVFPPSFSLGIFMTLWTFSGNL